MFGADRYPLLLPPTLAFKNASGISNVNTLRALNKFIRDMGNAGLLTKRPIIYVYAAGNAEGNSYNLVNPASNKITWGASGITHSSSGITGDGAAGFGNTGYAIPAGNQNNFGLSTYILNNVASSCAIGSARTSGGVLLTQLYPRSSGNFDMAINNGNASATAANSNSIGFYSANRTASNVTTGHKNSTQVITSANVSNTPNIYPLYVMARNLANVAQEFSTYIIGYTSIGTGLTPAEAVLESQIVTQLMRDLGRI